MIGASGGSTLDLFNVSVSYDGLADITNYESKTFIENGIHTLWIKFNSENGGSFPNLTVFLDVGYRTDLSGYLVAYSSEISGGTKAAMFFSSGDENSTRLAAVFPGITFVDDNGIFMKGELF